MREIRVRVRVIVEPDETGFHAYCPDLKGLHVAGDNEDEIRANVEEATIAYLKSLLKHNEPIPVGVLVSDDSQSISSFVFNKFKEKFSPSKSRQFIETVSVPLAAAA